MFRWSKGRGRYLRDYRSAGNHQRRFRGRTVGDEQRGHGADGHRLRGGQDEGGGRRQRRHLVPAARLADRQGQGDRVQHHRGERHVLAGDQRRGGGDLRRGGPDGQHHLRSSRGRADGGENEHHRARHGIPDQGGDGSHARRSRRGEPGASCGSTVGSDEAIDQSVRGRG
ncbi:unnamed protein product, partial [Ectocarpus sp. 4 AP-2014]